MNCNFKDLVEMKKEYDSKDVQDVILDLSKLYRLYYPSTISEMTCINRNTIVAYKSGVTKPSFGNYLILLELSKTV
jgi:hypothetical protein|nr:MAG TPA: PROTEIN HIPA [Caudoviricetes sp.]